MDWKWLRNTPNSNYQNQGKRKNIIKIIKNSSSPRLNLSSINNYQPSHQGRAQ